MLVVETLYIKSAIDATFCELNNRELFIYFIFSSVVCYKNNHLIPMWLRIRPKAYTLRPAYKNVLSTRTWPPLETIPIIRESLDLCPWKFSVWRERSKSVWICLLNRHFLLLMSVPNSARTWIGISSDFPIFINPSVERCLLCLKYSLSSPTHVFLSSQWSYSSLIFGSYSPAEVPFRRM